MLNCNYLNNKALNKTALAFIMLALLISLNCGKRTPPLPPVERVVQRVEISGFQRGNKVYLNGRCLPEMLRTEAL